MSYKIYAKIVFPRPLPLHKQKDEWRAKYEFRIESDKTIIEVRAKDSNAFRAIMNELTRYMVASEKIDKLLEKLS